MAKKFSELEAKMSPESRARSDAKAKRMLAELSPDQPTDADICEPNRAPIWNGRRNLDAAENSEQPLETNEGQTKPNEPTLTCSEVVERLPSANDARLECKELLEKALALIRVKQGSEAEFERLLAHALATFAEKKNRCHLDELSRRERRVQELEELLREIFSDTSQGAIPNPGDPWFEKTEKALAKSEQIRKGE